MSGRIEPWQRALLEEARRATLGTISLNGRPRLVPICFAAVDALTGAAIDRVAGAAIDRVAGGVMDDLAGGAAQPRPEPVDLVLWVALDEKPKRVDDVRTLARVRDVLRDPRVTVLVDRWSEDWAELAWIRLDGTAALVEPAGGGEHAAAVEALRRRYPQYQTHALEGRPLLRIEVGRVSGWRARG